MKSIYPFNTFTSISEKIRNLVREDLSQSLIYSNQKLAKQLSINPLVLKSKQQLKDIATATEESVYQEFNSEEDAYYETIVSMLCFLVDKSLTKDLVIFRLMINTADVKNLYTIPNVGELMVSEMLLCNADKALRSVCIENIIHHIGSRVSDARKSYAESEPYDHKDMSYYIPPEMKKEMNNLKEARVMDIVNSIQATYHNDPRHSIRADAIYDHMSMISSDDETESDETNSDSLKGVDELYNQDGDESDYSEIPDDMITGKTCQMCPKLYIHSYRTPTLDKEGNCRMKHFCSSQCMESWSMKTI